ncbi:myotubularin-related protein 10-B-like [Amphibalanus amphitrite]|uniref:myotubularin-related protein 10-B-like n=1 Tax=Amphibalanus amphitrite TaxID=1232801 RepID=UPI001C916008|nr:myotubularin-related protein 10-B-like [Amphibalanus amphitrite]
MKSFRSYIDLSEYVTDGVDSLPLPTLLPGEEVRATANDVLLYLPLAEQAEGIRGRLVVTNFKLAFVDSSSTNGERTSPRSLLLGEHEITLANVDTVHQLLSSGGKTRPLPPHSTVSGKIKGIQIRCKDFRLFTFSYRLSGVNESVDVTNALLFHCQPVAVGQLFAFHYRAEPVSPPPFGELDTADYWQAELERTGTIGWRVSHANEMYQMCRSLPQVLVVPKGVFDTDLVAASSHFKERRPPVWCWGNAAGAAIVRSAYTHPEFRQSTEERRVLDGIRACHPFQKEPEVLNVGAECPTIEGIQESYCKLRQLCAPDSVQAFELSDDRFLSQLGATHWMRFVSRCLKAAGSCVNVITEEGAACVLKESGGRDLTALVSCLAQLLLDPATRSRSGFERLVQREWGVLGHPFQERLGLLYAPDGGRKSPVFLLFLDCVHQLVIQHPDQFEFTATYLVCLWDSLFVPVFDTFLFNSQKQRVFALEGKEVSSRRALPRRPVWQWEQQFPSEYRDLFVSPLYAARAVLGAAERPAPLPVAACVAQLELWTLAYCRWSPLLHCPRAGRPAQQAHERHLLARLQQLTACVESERDGVVRRRPPPPPLPLPSTLPGSLAPFGPARNGAAPCRLLGVSSGFVSTLLRGSIATTPDEEDGGPQRPQYGS